MIELLHFNGANGSSTISNSGSGPVLSNTGVLLSTTQAKFGPSSAYFDGSSYLSYVGSALDFGVGDFRVEAQIYFSSLPDAYNEIFDTLNATGTRLGMGVSSSGQLFIYNGSFYFHPTSVSANAWHMVVAQRRGGILELYLDGVRFECATGDTTDISTGGVFIGRTPDGHRFTGYMDEIVIDVGDGSAIHTADFTPPTSEYGSVSTTGSMDVVEGKDTMSGAGGSVYPHSGSMDVVEGKDTFHGAGISLIPHSGSMNVTERKDALAGAGFFTYPTIGGGQFPALNGRGDMSTGVPTGGAVPLPRLQSKGSFAAKGSIQLVLSGHGSVTTGISISGQVKLTLQGKGRISTGSTLAGSCRLGVSLRSKGGFASSGRGQLAPLQASGRASAISVLRGAARLPPLMSRGSVSTLAGMSGRVQLPPLRSAGATRGSCQLLPLLGQGRLKTYAAWTVVDGNPIESFQHEAWSVNLRHLDGSDPDKTPIAESSQYTNYPFKQIFRFGQRYIAIGMDGNLYSLEGKTDNGAAISWEIRTALSDFGKIQFKAPQALYLGGRVENSFYVSVQTDDDPDGNQYADLETRGSGPWTNRARLAKGYRARYYGFGISNSGGSADIDSINVEFNQFERA